MKKSLVKAIVFGCAVGDAVGVPVEFMNRDYLKTHPVTNMSITGSHSQVPGTWSDDTSLLLGIVDGISEGYSLGKIAKNFTNWLFKSEFTAHGEVFDCGSTTESAIRTLYEGNLPLVECGLSTALSRGNGSLMRTLGLVPYIKHLDIEERYKITSDVSSLTHGHFTCKFACFFLCEYAITLLELKKKMTKSIVPLTAFILTQDRINEFITKENIKIDGDEFKRILGHLERIPIEMIKSGGFVIDTLEASIWSLIHTSDFEEAVLTSVNMGSDTDTTGAVTGTLAAMLYGYKSIPEEWINKLANKELLNNIVDKFNNESDII